MAVNSLILAAFNFWERRTPCRPRHNYDLRPPPDNLPQAILSFRAISPAKPAALPTRFREPPPVPHLRLHTACRPTTKTSAPSITPPAATPAARRPADPATELQPCRVAPALAPALVQCAYKNRTAHQKITSLARACFFRPYIRSPEK